MSGRMIFLILAWVIFVAFASVVALKIMQKRGMGGLPFAALTVFGAAASGLGVLLREMAMLLLLVGLAVFFAGSCGLLPEWTRKGHCKECGYDLRGETDAVCCPECGVARPGMEHRCRSCRTDIRSALAGGTIKCPHCGESVAKAGVRK
jgi:DNA-directed RNA polymerase subunit RPC12/RpoP